MNKTETTTVEDSIDAQSSSDEDDGDEDSLRRVLDPKTERKSRNGPDALRKARLSQANASQYVLEANTPVEIPWRDWNPEDAYEYPTTVELDGTRVHLHQDVREDSEDDFGNFGSIEEDTEDVVWTVVDLMDETVTLTVVGEWSKRRHVPFEDFNDEYEPITCTTPAGEVPRFGY